MCIFSFYHTDNHTIVKISRTGFVIVLKLLPQRFPWREETARATSARTRHRSKNQRAQAHNQHLQKSTTKEFHQ